MYRDFYKKLISLVIPIAFQQFMLALVSASDALMLGRLTQSALSAVSLASQVTFAENLFLAAMVIGLSTFAAQYWGKGDIDAVEEYFAYVFRVTVYISAFFMATAFFLPEQLMRIFTTDALLIEKGAIYLKAVSFSYLLTGISQMYLCILKNSGHATKSSIISSVCVVLNILFNAVLIFGLLGFPALEIEGAAVATVLARLIEVLWCIIETSKQNRVKLKWNKVLTGFLIKKTKKEYAPGIFQIRKDFWKYTLPVLGNQIVWGVGFTMYSVIMGHLGTDAVAANSIVNIVKNLILCFCFGLGMGGSIMVGNEMGAGRLDRAKDYGGMLCKMAILFGMVSGVFLLLLRPVVLSVTSLSEQAAHYLKFMFFICAGNMVGQSINSTTIGGIFCAGGDSRFGFVCDAVTMWIVIVPLGMISAFVWKFPVIWVFFIISLDEIIKLPVVYRRFKKYKWVKDLTKNND